MLASSVLISFAPSSDEESPEFGLIDGVRAMPDWYYTSWFGVIMTGAAGICLGMRIFMIKYAVNKGNADASNMSSLVILI